MADFRVHPVLQSPLVAGVVSSFITMAIVDGGVSELLARVGPSVVDRETWDTLIACRWVGAALSAGMAGFAWYLLFHFWRGPIRSPVAGIVTGVVGPIAGAAFILEMYQALHLPMFEVGQPVIWRLAYVWACLAALICVGLVRVGWQSYRVLRGAS